MMVALILASALVGQTPKTLMSQVIPHPTGKNGYEELVMAADVLQQGRFGTYERWARVEPVLIKDVNTPDGREDPDGKIYAELKGKTTLQKIHLISARFARVRELLAQAATKPIFEPREDINFESLMPELSQFRSIARYIALDSYGAYADGQGARAVSEMALGLNVFDRMGRSVLIDFLVNVACQSIVLASVEDHLSRFSQKDAKALEDCALEILARKPAIQDSMECESRFNISGIEKAFKGIISGRELKGLLDNEGQEKAKKTLERMNSADLQLLKNRILEQSAETGKKINRTFASPEAEWARIIEEDPTPPADWSSPTALSDAFASALLPKFVQVGRAAARNRAQLRILGLTCGVIRYRWENGVLPTTLADAVGEERAQDPLSGEPFIYKRETVGGFSIVSKGTKELGEIGLRYKKAASEDPGPP